LPGSPKASVIGMWQRDEGEKAGGVGRWCRNERPRSATAHRVAREQHGVLLDASPSRPTLGDHERADHSAHEPAAVYREPRREADLGVESTKGRLDVP